MYNDVWGCAEILPKILGKSDHLLEHNYIYITSLNQIY